MGKLGSIGNFERAFRSTAALHSSGRCSKYNSTTPLGEELQALHLKQNSTPNRINSGVDILDRIGLTMSGKGLEYWGNIFY